VHEALLSRAEDLGLVGRVVRMSGKVVAYTFGYFLNVRIFCVCLEVCDPSVKGLPAFIFSRFCADEALAGAEFINTMDDFGMPKVAQSKKWWNPVRLEPVYTVTRKSADSR
jgi:hypothetical protein